MKLHIPSGMIEIVKPLFLYKNDFGIKKTHEVSHAIEPNVDLVTFAGNKIWFLRKIPVFNY